MMDEDEDDEKRHFSLKNLVQEESSKKKRKKKLKKGTPDNKKVEDNFKVIFYCLHQVYIVFPMRILINLVILLSSVSLAKIIRT